MAHLIWTNDFTVGMEEFDEHHKHLIEMINTASDCVEQGAPVEEIGTILHSLVNYAWYHFSAEEKFMQQLDYPGYEEHLQQHRSFTSQVFHLQEKLAHGAPSVATELSAFLNFWLIDHIVISDSRYANFAGARTDSVLMT